MAVILKVKFLTSLYRIVAYALGVYQLTEVNAIEPY